MSIPGPLIRDGGNTNPSYQLQPLVSTDLTRGFLSWLGATREISWYSGLELILGVRILPPSLMGSRYRYITVGYLLINSLSTSNHYFANPILAKSDTIYGQPKVLSMIHSTWFIPYNPLPELFIGYLMQFLSLLLYLKDCAKGLYIYDLKWVANF